MRTVFLMRIISNISFYEKLQYRLSLGKGIGLVIFFFAILLFYFVVIVVLIIAIPTLIMPKKFTLLFGKFLANLIILSS